MIPGRKFGELRESKETEIPIKESVEDLIEKIENSPEEKQIHQAERNWLENAKRKFASIFSKEKALPPLSIDIFYAPHCTSEDLKDFENRLRSSDIYIPEQCGWDEKVVDLMNKISHGEIEEDFFRKATEIEGPHDPDSFAKQELQVLYKSGKPITVIDVPAGHPIARRYGELYAALEHERFLTSGRSFESALKEFKAIHREFSKLDKEREVYMLSQFKPKIRELIENRKELFQKKKNVIRVLLSLGSSHTALYHAFKRGGENVSRSFPSKPYSFTFISEFIRRGQFGLEINNELAARALLQRYFYRYFSGDLHELTADSSKIIFLIRKIISPFDFHEIRDLYNKTNFEPQSFRIFFTKKLQDKGIQLPTTKQELDTFLFGSR